MRRAWLISWLLVAAPPLSAAEPDLAPVRAWIDHARSVKSVTAEFRQERYLRAVSKPLISSGRFWYRAPGAIRWQLGEPPKMIALRTAADGDLTVLEPVAKVMRTFSAAEAQDQGGALAFLDAGFPSSVESFQDRLRIDAVERRDGQIRVSGQFKGNRLSVAVMKVVFVIDEARQALQGLEIWLRDGSKIISLFTDVKENTDVPVAVFSEPTDGYRVAK